MLIEENPTEYPEEERTSPFEDEGGEDLGSDLYKTPEDELRERGPIFTYTKEIEGEERKFVSIAGVELEVNAEGEGSMFSEEEFEDYSIDEGSLDILKRMAISVKLNEPFLLEAPTDMGKSRAFEYLAHLTNHKLNRISFSGQTDVTELIGQFVPNTETARETFLRTLSQHGKLHPDSRELLQKTRDEGRSLTLQESKTIAELEGIDLKERVEWVWEDGTLPRSMTGNEGRGTWIYFDELGAGSPEVLVRLNRLFERKRRLEITEQGNRIVEAGPDFRMGATTNDPKSAGRRPFAPDFIRRFLYNKLSGLSPHQIRQRMAFVFRGERAELPEEMYTRPRVERPILLENAPELSERIEELLSQFHESAVQAIESGLAKDQTQPIQFEFSDILRVKKYIEGVQTADVYETLMGAVNLVYVSKLGDEDARRKLRDIFQTAASILKSPEKIREAQERVNPERRISTLFKEIETQEGELREFEERIRGLTENDE